MTTPSIRIGGCGSVWRAAVRRERLSLLHEQAVADVPIRFEGLPGEYLQVDWGEIRHFPFTQQKPVTRYFLACRLKYSRWTWVIFTDNMRQETLFRGLVACFNALGFVPWVLVFDNMKTVTTGRDDQQQPIWHRSLLQLAAEFDFHPEACWPASGNQKGSVESLVKFVKINFLTGRSFVDDADSTRVSRVAGLRQHDTAVTGDRRDASVAAGGGGRQGISTTEDGRRLRLRRTRRGE